MTQNEDAPFVVPVTSPWLDTLLDALSQIQHSLLMVSPYIKDGAVAVMEQALMNRVSQENREIEIRVITRVNPDDFLNGASDISALQQILGWSTSLPGSAVEMRAIPNVHAKVWVCDRQLAIIGSGNATLPGLNSNLEYGLAVSNPQIVERILSDWQQWWEPAQQVEAPLLEQLAQKLHIIKEGEDMQQARVQNERVKQQARRLARIGKAVTFTRKGKYSISPLIKEQNEQIMAADVNSREHPAYVTHPAPDDLQEPAISPEAIDISVADFWQALRWILPFDENSAVMTSISGTSQANIKLAWKPVPPEHQMLQLIWADGKRYSQAALPAHNDVLKQPWAVTLNGKQVLMLGEMLQLLKEEDFFVKGIQQQFHMLLRTSSYPTLVMSYLRNPKNHFTSEAIVVPCTPASIPGSFPALQTPLACMTVVHEQLQDALSSLSHEWQRLQTNGMPLTAIELGFSHRGTDPVLTLSTGQIEAAITISIVGTDGIFAGPEVRLRVDFASLHQVITGSLGNIHSWRLCVDKYIDAIQFFPEPALYSDTSLVWRHELRNLPGL